MSEFEPEAVVVSLDEIEGMTDDPGCDWHPGKPSAYDVDGNLVDLTEAEVAEHRAKPEADEQPDGHQILEHDPDTED